MNLPFLQSYNETTFGPIQQDEALFLYGLCRMVRPKKVLEFGSLLGQSAKVWAEYGQAEIHCVDIKISKDLKELASTYGNILLHESNMVDFRVPDGMIFDFVFIDASHKADDNISTILNIKDDLPDGAIIGFHDTGHWAHDHMDKEKWWFFNEFGGQDCLEYIVHHPGEKETIKQISKMFPDWQRFDFWTLNVPRYGITLFKVNKKKFKV